MTAPTIDFASGDHYAVLGVSKSAGEADLTRAYRTSARQYHPDKNTSPNAEVAFKRVSEAYSVLRDAEKRREYDRSGGVRSYVSYEEAARMWRSYGEDEAAGPQDDDRRKAIAAFVVFVTLAAVLPKVVQQLLPGLTIALVGVAAWSASRRQGVTNWAWLALLLLVVSYVAPAAQQLRSNGLNFPGRNAGKGAIQKGSQKAQVPVGMVPHSGEEILMSDGRFVRLSDPQNRQSGETSVTEGWQQRLLGDMTNAIKSGEEQVVMVFSREGCPWCDRLLPVLHRAIQRRSGIDVETPLEGAAQAFLLPGAQSRAAVGMGAVPSRSSGLLFAPIRVFVFDAAEFPYFVQAFKVEAFPTIIAWGPPGVTPLAAQGYLDDANFAELLKTVATGKVEEEPAAKKKGLFR